MRALAVLLLLAAASSAAGSLTVDVTTKSDKGIVRCALWTGADGFPVDVKTKASVKLEAPSIAQKKATCVFPDVGAGTYAVTILHDLDSDNELAKNLIGIPKEPLGFSSGARARFAPPKWDDAKFAYDGKDTTIAIAVH